LRNLQEDENLDELCNEHLDENKAHLENQIGDLDGVKKWLDYPEYSETPLYISHEGLLLNFEHAMTRRVRSLSICEEPTNSTTSSEEESGSSAAGLDSFYDLSSQFLWIGERTSNIDEAHIEFFRGVTNPIGLKVGPNRDAEHVA